jgi:hypothetical protein
MVVIESYVAWTLFALAVVAALAVVVVLGAVIAQVGLTHRRRRLTRHETGPAYYRRIVPSH